MVEVKLCIIKLDGTSEYRRIAIPVLTTSTDVLAVLREKLSELFPELMSATNGIHHEFQYEGRSENWLEKFHSNAIFLQMIFEVWS